MDNYYVESDIIESTNILRPPVKRDRRFADDTYIAYIESDSRSEGIGYSFQQLQSSLSLILQKTSKRKIIEQHSVFTCKTSTKNTSEESSAQNKPATVLPKGQHKDLKNHKRQIHATTSTQEKPIESQKLYIVVTGNDKEKIYQLKTIGSAKLTQYEYGGDVNEFYNKEVHKALQMERKKKKDKVKKVPSPTKHIVGEYTRTVDPRFCNCIYNRTDGEAGPSRVKIYGQLGINDQEKYILQCAATVNDKPVQNYKRAEENSSESLARFTSEVPDKNEKRYIDTMTMTSKLQSPPISHNNYDRLTNIENLCRIIGEEHEKRLFMESDLFKNNQRANNTLNKGTQATQPDVNTKTPFSAIDKIIQCNCKPMIDDVQYFSSTDTNKNTNGESDSPLVIISVYPKHKSVKTVAYAAVAPHQYVSYTPMLQREKSPVKIINDKQQSIVKNKVVKVQRTSRSYSPAKKASKSKMQERNQQNISVVRTARTNPMEPRSRSPGSPKSISPSNYKSKRNEITEPYQEKTRLTTKSPIRSTEKHQDKTNRNAMKSQNQSVNYTVKPLTKNVEKLKKNSVKQKYNQNKTIKTNAPIIQSKEMQYSNTRNDVSKVSVNIQSETEFYDVVFEQSKYQTDVMVRKTTKESASQRKPDKCINSDSLDNCLLDDVNNIIRPVSKAFRNPTAAPVPKDSPKINVRDSIELSHRREYNKDKNKDTQTKRRDGEDFVNRNNEATKHFSGDNCIIPDPVVRDKEIRSLLGIQKINKKQQTMNNSACFSRRDLLVADGMNKICKNDLFFKRNIPTIDMDVKHESCMRHDNEKSEHVLYNNPKTIDQLLKYDEPNETNRLKLSVNETYIELKTSISEKLNPKNKPHNYITEGNLKQKCIHLSRTQYSKVKRSIQRKSEKMYKRKFNWKSRKGLATANTQSDFVIHWDREIQTDKITLGHVPNEMYKLQAEGTGDHKLESFEIPKENTCDKIYKGAINSQKSIEIVHASAYVKTECSFTNIGLRSSTVTQKKRDSIETIFKGHRKSQTPNLGTSSLSLKTDCKSGTKSESGLASLKTKRPFLRRLMSCLVMHLGKVADVNVTASPVTLQSVNSSLNSYHISSSLAAFEMSSSLYTTTASFYSSHSVGPLNNKIKRGFLSFLTCRKP